VTSHLSLNIAGRVPVPASTTQRYLPMPGAEIRRCSKTTGGLNPSAPPLDPMPAAAPRKWT